MSIRLAELVTREYLQAVLILQYYSIFPKTESVLYNTKFAEKILDTYRSLHFFVPLIAKD